MTNNSFKIYFTNMSPWQEKVKILEEPSCGTRRHRQTPIDNRCEGYCQENSVEHGIQYLSRQARVLTRAMQTI